MNKFIKNKKGISQILIGVVFVILVVILLVTYIIPISQKTGDIGNTSKTKITNLQTQMTNDNELEVTP